MKGVVLAVIVVYDDFICDCMVLVLHLFITIKE